MESSSNLSTLVTIIFGLMLTDLFASAHRLIRHRARVGWHWLPVLVGWYLLTMILKNWWGLVFREDAGIWGNGWIFFYYGHLLLLLYLVASAALPDEVPEEGLDLREEYFRHRRQFWGLLTGVSLLLMLYALARPLFGEALVQWPGVLSNLVLGSVTLSLAWTGREGYHKVVVVVLVLLSLLEFVAKFGD